MSGLLISVRDAGEALTALRGGADVIDVKEPARGALGRADAGVWTLVRQAIGPDAPMSAALGELTEWLNPLDDIEKIKAELGSVAFCKLGLAGCLFKKWRQEWRGLRQSLPATLKWVAVAYVDHAAAHAPDPREVVDEANRSADIAGVLFDTFDKASGSIDRASHMLFECARLAKSAGRFVVAAGSLNKQLIERFDAFEPDLFAVRAAACEAGGREGAVQIHRVRELKQAVLAREGVVIQSKNEYV